MTNAAKTASDREAMTARAMLLSDEEMVREGYGKHMVRHLYEAERNRLLDEIDGLKAMVPRWCLKSETPDAFHFIRHEMVATPEGWDEWWLIAPGEEPK